MDDQPKYQPQAQSHFFADGRTMRTPVSGTIPFGARADGNDQWVAVGRARRDFLKADDRVYLGLDADGAYLEDAPLAAVLGLPDGAPVTPAQVKGLIERGRERYNIYCIVCHGGAGDGDGMVGRRWSYPLPNYHDPKYAHGGEKGQDGYLFHVIRNGVPNPPGQQPPLRMPSYAERVTERDAWAIVTYIRTLQATRRGEITDVPESLRRDLLNSRGATDGGTQ